ncbi:fimbria/pilus chaperone family protein [Cupriavidus agavae]|uniref:P pilus assembly chaperone PapD n=1 Tax=Cupriavidus agavae TaxID=1001822 RepID=A0A4Q7RRN5_9BURK|nr:fimbria/pilus chaperone family protein [Cupriavidus agavae]RZT36313.1 P pilus assembly chaperone PapD [Cupriavidus agavae]
MKNRSVRTRLSLGAAAVLVGVWGTAMATGMVPETSVVLVNEADGESTMNVKNSEASPQLLYTSVNHIDEDKEELVVVTPPVARVEANETQVVRFILRNKTPLKTQRLARAVFEGIPPRTARPGDARVTMTVRQDLPLVIHPKGLPMEREPWKKLRISLTGTELLVENPSPYVVRLSQSVLLQPGGETAELPRPYVLPETTVRVPLKSAPSAPTALRLAPATLYGFAVDFYDAPLSTAPATPGKPAPSAAK